MQYKSMVSRYFIRSWGSDQFRERLIMMYQNAVKRILRYVKGTLDHSLVYSKGTGHYLLSGYSDSDLASNIDDRKSTKGMVFYLNESLITLVIQKQRCVSISSSEAEFMTAMATVCHGIWIRNLLSQI